MISIPKERARRPTSRPTLPTPTIPIVLPCSSVPTNLPRSHRPAFIEASACGIIRASESSSDIVCSAAETVFPPGTFITTIPARVAASASTLSTPVPARPITRRRFAAPMIAAVTLVWLRTTSAVQGAIAALRSSPAMPGRYSTVTPLSARNRSTQRSETSSVIRTLISSVIPGSAPSSHSRQDVIDHAQKLLHLGGPALAHVRDAERLPLEIAVAVAEKIAAPLQLGEHRAEVDSPRVEDTGHRVGADLLARVELEGVLRPRAGGVGHPAMTLPAGGQPFLEDQRELPLHREEVRKRRRDRRLALCGAVGHPREIEVPAAIGDQPRALEDLRRDGTEGEPGRERQAFLNAREAEVDPHLVHVDGHAAEGADGVDHVRHVGVLLHDLADGGDRVGDAGRRLAVRDRDGVVVPGAELFLDRGGVDRLAPGDLQSIGGTAVEERDLVPSGAEGAVDQAEDLPVRAAANGGLHQPRRRRGREDDGVLRPHDPLRALGDGPEEADRLLAAVADRRTRHRVEHVLPDVGGAGYEELHQSSSVDVSPSGSP